jgi:predicted N-acetyltransferase YhbS
MNIKITNAEIADLEAILQLQYTAFHSEAVSINNFKIQPLTQTLDELIAEYNNSVILKAVLNDEIIGSVRAYADGDTVYIGKLIVHPDHQGKGLGKRLLAAIEEKLHRKRFELFTGYKSERNLSLYKKAGYARFHEKITETGVKLVYFEKYCTNMHIKYIDTIEEITSKQLQGFFAGWKSPLTPERHYELLRGSTHFIVAFDSDIAIGFITALSDSVNSAFIPLLEVLPEYQKCGIGSELVWRMLVKLDDISNIDLICDPDMQPFYERFKMIRSTGMILRKHLHY